MKITASLIGSWQYYMLSSEDEEKDKEKREEFLNTLKGVWFDNKKMQAGRDFEACVTAMVNNVGYNHEYKYSKQAQTIASMVRGGILQKRVEVDYSGINLVGVIDVVLPNRLVDVKFTSRQGMGSGAFQKSIQHHLYLTAMELLGQSVDDFSYLICHTSGEVFEEEYKLDRDYLDFMINEFIDYLSVDREASYYYNEYFNKNRRKE